ncbi:MAG: hypothetical protein EOP56_09440 [Sphingobacteriales bacterium]|nr:MAG: hypothetical protein EOP56_09440 [Sphingobacteriales bacterium]
MTRNEFIIGDINPLQPSAGLAQYNTAQISRIVIGQGLNSLRNVPQGPEPDKPLYASTMLGTPVMADLQILGGSYTGRDGKKYTVPDIRLETVLISVSQTKNIITTQVANRDGTTKEYIGLGDYMVSISLILAASNGVYPKEEMAALGNALKAPVTLGVVSEFLQQWDIDNLVITDFATPQEPGKYSTQTVSIQALSDDNFYINL